MKLNRPEIADRLSEITGSRERVESAANIVSPVIVAGDSTKAPWDRARRWWYSALKGAVAGEFSRIGVGAAAAFKDIIVVDGIRIVETNAAALRARIYQAAFSGFTTVDASSMDYRYGHNKLDVQAINDSVVTRTGTNLGEIYLLASTEVVLPGPWVLQLNQALYVTTPTNNTGIYVALWGRAIAVQ